MQPSARFPRFFEIASGSTEPFGLGPPCSNCAMRESQPGDDLCDVCLGQRGAHVTERQEVSRNDPREPTIPTIDVIPGIDIDAFVPVRVRVERAGRAVTDAQSRGDFDSTPVPNEPPSADMVACYRPWHVWGKGWGIWINEPALRSFTAWIAKSAGIEAATLAPLVLRQVLEHEWTHFSFEVVGAHIEHILQGVTLYRAYVTWRYSRPSRWSPGPLEETVATWHEVQFARRVSRVGIGRSYVDAVEDACSKAPPGYREWRVMDPRGKRGHVRWTEGTKVVAGVASNIADRPEDWTIANWRPATSDEKRQVPVNWIGDPGSLSVYAATPKSYGQIPIKSWEKFLRKAGAIIDSRAGKGDHRVYRLPDGRRGTYDPGHGHLYGPALKQAMETFRMATREQFYRHVISA